MGLNTAGVGDLGTQEVPGAMLGATDGVYVPVCVCELAHKCTHVLG